MASATPQGKFNYDPLEIQRAKQLRKKAPMVERLLWQALCSTAKTHGLRFRRQHVISPYIVDFICLRAMLVIEIDGPSHDVRQVYDTKREHFLEGLGYSVVRFTNQDVRENLEGVVETIMNAAKERHLD